MARKGEMFEVRPEDILSQTINSLIEETKVNKDITKETARTMDLLNDMLNDFALPISSLSARYMDSNYPRLMKVFRWAFRKRLTKINEIYFSGHLTSEMFNRMKTYRLLLYKLSS